MRSKEEVLRLKAIVEAKAPILPSIQQPAKRLSTEEVQAKVIAACKHAIANPQLKNRDLAILVGIREKTLEKHAKTITSARKTGICPKDTPDEHKRPNRKGRASDVNKRNPRSADYEGGR